MVLGRSAKCAWGRDHRGREPIASCQDNFGQLKASSTWIIIMIISCDKVHPSPRLVMHRPWPELALLVHYHTSRFHCQSAHHIISHGCPIRQATTIRIKVDKRTSHPIQPAVSAAYGPHTFHQSAAYRASDHFVSLLQAYSLPRFCPGVYELLLPPSTIGSLAPSSTSPASAETSSGLYAPSQARKV